MADVRIPDSILPGETVRIDFEVINDNQAQQDLVIHGLKQAIWADPRFDYQGSKTITVGSLELGRDIKQLSIYATLRKTLRQERAPIEYASMSSFEAYIKAAASPWMKVVRFIGSRIEAVAVGIQTGIEAGLNTAKTGLMIAGMTIPVVAIGGLLIAAVIFHRYFFGPSKGRD